MKFLRRCFVLGVLSVSIWIIYLTTSFLDLLLCEAPLNNRPIIGVLAQELSFIMKGKYPKYGSYIAASYVKGVEGSGARVVPIFINQSEEYYRHIVGSVNGVVLPGGASYFSNKNGFAEAGEILMKIANEANDNGTYFPVLGICLGFELMLYIDNDMQEYRASCWAKRISLPLEFKNGHKNSKLYSKASDEILYILSTMDVTLNEHMYCVTEKNMTAFNLDKSWRLLSLNKDPNTDVTFVSSVESKQYPYAGIQFHPEKNIYEWKENRGYVHTYEAVVAARYFFDWIVGEARQNYNNFNNKTEQTNSLIYNYQIDYSAKRNLVYNEMYIFE